MAIFFFVVGLEIKKELVIGELSTFKKAALPFSAAIGGMLFPALFYLSLNSDFPQSKGWAIPMATDIAFAIGLLTIFGKKVPLALKIFLLAIAIVDDLGAILVIAFFYTDQIKTLGLLSAAILILLILSLNHFKFHRYIYYIPIGVLLWFSILYAGIHATIAGVILGLLTPVRIFDQKKNTSRSPVDELIHLLHPWIAFFIMPVFAFANAGLIISFSQIKDVINSSVFNGIFLGLVIGKPIGILALSYLACCLKIAELPKSLNWIHILAVGCIAGIGFTMSLFISSLALSADLEIYSKTAILIASIAAAIIGSFALSYSFKTDRSHS